MYAKILQLRNWFFDKGIFKASEFDFPIINVGNLAVGGSGKTPHIEYLIRLLSEQYRIATLSRGYGRKTKGYRELSADCKAVDCGDEPVQIKNQFPDIGVFVGEDRVEAITKLLFDAPNTEVILLDDAYQHRAIKAGVNILLTDYSKIFTRDKSMPIGRLRECPPAANRADIVIVTKCPKDLSAETQEEITNEISEFTKARILFSSIQYDELKVFNRNTEIPSQIENIMVLSGIANPAPMIHFIKEKFSSQNIEHIQFRDHHNYSKKDLQNIIEKFNSFADQNKILIISEKDAARLQGMISGTEFENIPAFTLPIKINFLGDNKEYFNNYIQTYVRENKADYSIYSEQD